MTWVSHENRVRIYTWAVRVQGCTRMHVHAVCACTCMCMCVPLNMYACVCVCDVCVGVSVVSRSLSRSRLPYKQASSDTATRAGASAKSRQDCRQVRRARAAAHRCGRRQVSSRSYREHILVAREHILAARECILAASELVRLAIPPAHPRHLQISLWGLDFIHVWPCG